MKILRILNITIIAGACVGIVGGIISFIKQGSIPGIISGVTFIIIIVFGFGTFYRNSVIKNKLKKTGVSATARIIRIPGLQ